MTTTSSDSGDMAESMLGLSTYAHDKCLINQINFLTIYYILVVACDAAQWWVGPGLIADGGIICAREHYLLVETPEGGYYMLFHGCCVLFYSLCMFYVFYGLPRKYNLISYQKMFTKKITANKSLIIVSGSMVC